MDLIVLLIIGNLLFIGSLVIAYYGKKIIFKNNTMGKALIYSSYIVGAIGVILICIVFITYYFLIWWLVSI